MLRSSSRGRSSGRSVPHSRSIMSLLARSLRCERLEDRRMLAPIVVTTDQDLVDFNDGKTSLREAIFAANTVPGPDEIVFDFGHDGPATIFLEHGELQIEEALTIAGAGAGLLTIDAQQQSRIFNITATTGEFVISGMTLTRGSTSGVGTAFAGGAIRSASVGLLTLDGMHLVANRTLGNDANGGAVFAAGDITSTTSTFTDNQTAGSNSHGGAVFTSRSLTANETDFTSNRTAGNGSSGGAINAVSLMMASSTVSRNSTTGVNAPGGGINVGRLVEGTSSLIVDSFIQDNYTLGTNSRGGGVSSAVAITVERSAISGNVTFGGNADGGGLYTAIGILRDTAFTENRTYGADSSGGAAAGGQSRPDWQIISSSFIGNETLGSSSHGGALAVRGSVSVTGSNFQDNSVLSGGGGAIYFGPASFMVSVSSSSFTDNSASFGGAIDSRTNTSIVESEFIDNRANWTSFVGGEAGGGAIYVAGLGGLTIARSKIADNQASGPTVAGGGIRAAGPVTITASEISNNRAIGQGGRGGGLFSQGSTTIVDSTISENHVIGNGGTGGGVSLSFNSRSSLMNSTISGNQITGEQARGGGLYAHGTVILHSTVTGNRINSATGEAGGLWVNQGEPGPATPGTRISHSIVAGNFVGTAASDLRSLPLLRNSLVGTLAGTEFAEAPVGSPDADGNIIGGPVHGVIDPLLGPLAENGGPTLTHALLPGSPAINAGDPSAVSGANGIPEFDQRGAPFARIAGGRIDIGAYESQPAGGLLNGDFDGDGDVDGRDFLLWQRGYTMSGPHVEKSTGDATGNQLVDGNDLAVWQATYSEELPAMSAPMSARLTSRAESPEPERSMAPWAVPRLDDVRDRVPCYDDICDPVFYLPTPSRDYAEILDRAFDHWLPPRRPTADFGDIVTRRGTPRYASATIERDGDRLT